MNPLLFVRSLHSDKCGIDEKSNAVNSPMRISFIRKINMHDKFVHICIFALRMIQIIYQLLFLRIYSFDPKTYLNLEQMLELTHKIYVWSCICNFKVYGLSKRWNSHSGTDNRVALFFCFSISSCLSRFVYFSICLSRFFAMYPWLANKKMMNLLNLFLVNLLPGMF